MTTGLNPLHCGAVVASSGRAERPRTRARVSIPFIAGQWSLPSRSAWTSPRSSTRLNPLHCGAVVASSSHHLIAASPHGVSIPFIAGQWSLRRNAFPPEGGASRVSIPFIAGQWSLRGRMGRQPFRAQGFNPLHCGAVVASEPAGSPGPKPGRVSIPFIAGQWSLPLSARLERSGQPHVSIPFIAGQWSLPPHGGGGQGGTRNVSIPYIAGQWSLRDAEALVKRFRHVFQSPSLRGSGRFEEGY